MNFKQYLNLPKKLVKKTGSQFFNTVFDLYEFLWSLNSILTRFQNPTRWGTIQRD